MGFDIFWIAENPERKRAVYLLNVRGTLKENLQMLKVKGDFSLTCQCAIALGHAQYPLSRSAQHSVNMCGNLCNFLFLLYSSVATLPKS